MYRVNRASEMLLCILFTPRKQVLNVMLLLLLLHAAFYLYRDQDLNLILSIITLST